MISGKFGNFENLVIFEKWAIFWKIGDLFRVWRFFDILGIFLNFGDIWNAKRHMLRGELRGVRIISASMGLNCYNSNQQSDADSGTVENILG